MVASLTLACSGRVASSTSDPTPQTIEEFQATASRILHETGVPGAGISLVRSDGVEWEGGLGYADRDARTAVTADTHFRVGSISKTFVAMALVQLYEDGLIDIEAPVEDVAPDVAVENAWRDSEPVRIIHLLEHTAGFDDMHFNEMYVPDAEAERSLADVLAINPRSRAVRWKPGERMSYSNPGYTVAGLILEKASGQPFEDYIKREIFVPLGMLTSNFRMTVADEALMARGYAGPHGPSVGYPRMYLRPSGNMHSSAREMGRFVRMMLNWGELDTAFIVDPEYLGNMEQPRTTLASRGGLRSGYGSGIAAFLAEPYPLLGHDGGIEGFLSIYAYSPSRDVGFVILLNSLGGREAMRRLSSLAIRFLKRDVEAPKPEVRLMSAQLDEYVGYYQDANPRYQIAWPVQRMFTGRSIIREGDSLYAVPVLGARQRLIPVTETSFRYEHENDASRVFTHDTAGGMVLTGMMLYAERHPRWQVELVRIPVLAALAVIASVFLVAIAWVARIRRAQPHGFWGLKIPLLLCPMLLIAPAGALALTSPRNWGVRNTGTWLVFFSTIAIPVFAATIVALTVAAQRRGAGRFLTSYGVGIGVAMAVVSLYLFWHDLVGLRLWMY